MFPKTAIGRFFLCCTILIIIGEAHRRATAPPSPAENTTSQNIPHKILLDKSKYVFPVSGKSRENLIGFFGDSRAGGKRKHKGIDIAAKRGTFVVAVTDGTVTKVKEGGNGGKQVWMKGREKNLTFYYAHLHSQSVRVGQKVKQGDELGTVGNTGNARDASPHLHFEILTEERKAVDPLELLP